MKSSATSDRSVCSNTFNDSINGMQSRANHTMGGAFRDNYRDGRNVVGKGGNWDDALLLDPPHNRSINCFPLNDVVTFESSLTSNNSITGKRLFSWKTGRGHGKQLKQVKCC
jgi:hypothetical protein